MFFAFILIFALFIAADNILLPRDGFRCAIPIPDNV
jgi:hypothetical protein